MGKKLKQWQTLFSWAPADSDCSHEIKRHLLLRRKAMYQKTETSLCWKGPSSQTYGFTVVMYGCESWTIKKAVVAVQQLSHVQLIATPWTAAPRFLCPPLSPKVCSNFKSVMPSNHLILCRPLLLLPSIFPSIRVFSNESAVRIRWPKYWSFSFSPANEYSGLISFGIDWLDLLAV